MEKITYLVQMVKGTDDSYDETSAPRTLFETADKQKALAFYGTLPKYQPLDVPETDLDGNEIYETPVLLAVYHTGEEVIIKEG
jgi:hypothetical protein